MTMLIETAAYEELIALPGVPVIASIMSSRCNDLLIEIEALRLDGWMYMAPATFSVDVLCPDGIRRKKTAEGPLRHPERHRAVDVRQPPKAGRSTSFAGLFVQNNGCMIWPFTNALAAPRQIAIAVSSAQSHQCQVGDNWRDRRAKPVFLLPNEECPLRV